MIPVFWALVILRRSQASSLHMFFFFFTTILYYSNALCKGIKYKSQVIFMPQISTYRSGIRRLLLAMLS